MHWILQNNIFNETKYDELTDFLTRMNILWSQHKVVPFIGELHPTPVLVTKNVICIGSYSMRHIARTNGWTPGVFDILAENFEVQREHWGQELLNFDSVVSTFQDVRFVEDYHFVRPIEDSKHFAGKVFDRYEFLEWQNKVCVLKEDTGVSLHSSTLVQMTTPKEILREVRYWIVKGKIITSSVYKIGDRVQYMQNLDEPMDAYVEHILGIWQPAETFVLDVCDTPVGFKIVEPNCLNAAGFYAADVQRLVMALEDAYSV